MVGLQMLQLLLIQHLMLPSVSPSHALPSKTTLIYVPVALVCRGVGTGDALGPRRKKRGVGEPGACPKDQVKSQDA